VSEFSLTLGKARGRAQPSFHRRQLPGRIHARSPVRWRVGDWNPEEETGQERGEALHRPFWTWVSRLRPSPGSFELVEVHFADDQTSQFSSLVESWRRDAVATSSVERMAMHPAYQRIIGLGPIALPLVLRELEERPDHWFWALRAISGEDPAEGQDTFEGARQAWLAWGRGRGYLIDQSLDSESVS
jgi:hypothetical protein